MPKPTRIKLIFISLLMGFFFYSCSSTKTTTTNSKAGVVITFDDYFVNEWKNRGMQYFLLFILFVIFSIFGAVKYFSINELKSFSDQMNLGVQIKSYTKLGGQIDLFVSAEEWKKLSPQKKLEAFQKVSTYLDTEKRISNAILFDDKRAIIKVIAKGQTYIKPPEEEPAAQPTQQPATEPAPDATVQ